MKNNQYPQYIHVDIIRISMMEMLENLPDVNKINLANTLIIIAQEKQRELNDSIIDNEVSRF